MVCHIHIDRGEVVPHGGAASMKALNYLFYMCAKLYFSDGIIDSLDELNYFLPTVSSSLTYFLSHVCRQ
jgi:hypothetical protein